jgi:hypothetical protein
MVDVVRDEDDAEVAGTGLFRGGGDGEEENGGEDPHGVHAAITVLRRGVQKRRDGELVRGLGLLGAIALVAGNVIGSGIYVIPASLADVAGPLSLLAWPIVAAGYLFLNAMYADLAEAYPYQGGLQVYVERAFGPLAGLIASSMYWISCVIGNAAFVTAFVGYAQVFFPVFAKPLPAFLLAQAIASHVSVVAWSKGEPPKKGVLLGARAYRATRPYFPAGSKLTALQSRKKMLPIIG